MSGNNIKVVCRFRPQNKLEIAEGGTPIIAVSDDQESVRIEGKEFQGDFSFDRVFGMNTPQNDIFQYSIKSIVDDVVGGYNGTVFAYGQTGSGKTFTMMGADIDNEDLKGIIPRIVEQIFRSIIESPANMEFTVKVSYMEIYMEKIRDLLNPAHDNLPIHEDKTNGVYVKGLLEVYVSSIAEVFEVMRRGGQARVVAYTNMNAESSRSHSIFVITITQKNLDNGSAKSGRLFLVDLAGSEKVGKTGASGQTLEEAKKINKSLSALGMVINALTDGKSTHIPYRDSKLTRILQESLGGNSRTTLIINSSPSSYNEAETLGTMRFGMRAKSIKNKAKVNADLSPAELKALLKKVKSDSLNFQQYISALEGEVSVWRMGGTVAEAKWATLEKVKGGEIAPVSPAPGFKLPMEDSSRPATPAIVFEKDEREEYMKRENELQDQIAEKEQEIATKTELLESIKEELAYYKEQESIITTDNQKMAVDLSNASVLLEKYSNETKENAIAFDSLKESNQELNAELEGLKKALTELKLQQKETLEGEKEKKKAEKMAQMMASFDPDPSGEMSEKENQIRDALSKLDIDAVITLSPEEIIALRKQLSESKSLIEKHEQAISDLSHEKEALETKRNDLETRLVTLELELEELLEKSIQDEENVLESTELKGRLESAYNSKREMQQKEIEDLKKELERKSEEVHKLSSSLTELKRANEELQTHIQDSAAAATQPNRISDLSEKEKDMERMRKSMAQQLSDFEVMKKALMRDLQNRCEKVVELEISLDETREQYNNVLRMNNNKAQQKKMAFLERNLEQLTNVQKQLVEQNSSLKKEVAVAERKLIARNERIQSLESLLQEAQEKLITQNQKFEAQLQAVRERLEQAKAQKAQSNAGLGLAGRIAKPLRGGAAVAENPNGDANSTTKKQQEPDRRISWIPFR